MLSFYIYNEAKQNLNIHVEESNSNRLDSMTNFFNATKLFSLDVKNSRDGGQGLFCGLKDLNSVFRCKSKSLHSNKKCKKVSGSSRQ